MLYPTEDREEGELKLYCRTCDRRSTAVERKVFARQISELEEAKAIPWKEIANDISLPRTYSLECFKCHGREAVNLQVNYRDHVAVYFVCAQCGHHWDGRRK
jgi:DNA-directed RNA polymerase II subunit RPB9